MKEIENREDIGVLVNKFYAKVRKDDLLGPIFNTQIPNENWKEHLIKLTDFWETNLFGIPKFKGSPSQKHVLVDKNFDYTISQVHFGKWLELWFETINELYVGEIADRAKESARRMATGQFLTMYHHRPKDEVL